MTRVLFSCLFAATLLAQSSKPLPKPATSGGKPLMQALQERKSSRDFKPGRLSDQTLSNLLWAAAGINRPDGRRTAPTARNVQDIDIYVATADGVYLYDPKAHALHLVVSGDHRKATGTQAFVADAAVNLVYVSDAAKMGKTPEQDKLLYAGVHAGAVAQNVYLFCASEGLGAVVRASLNRDELAKLLKLRPEQRIVVAQSVGPIQ
jgi:SagB-type dehydrogenase family enzyme